MRSLNNMYRLITFAASIIMAVSLFVLFTKPTFENVRASQAEAAGYTQALADAERLNQRINELVTQRNNLPSTEMEKLEILIPERVDEVSTVITLDTLAARHFLVFSDIVIAKAEGASTPTNRNASNNQNGAPLPGAPEKEAIEATAVKFAVSGTYDDFRAFIKDVEATLSLMDINDLSILGEDDDSATPNVYAVTAQIYNYKQDKPVK